MNRPPWEVVIVGAGPAGLSAALTLGRCGRSVLLCDMDTPRSWASKEMHGFLTRDGIDPRQFRRLAHKELRRYKNVLMYRGEVVFAQRERDGTLRVRLQHRRPVRCRKLLIATGVFDELPPIPGIEAFFGKSVFQCPYCDGWELRGEPVAVYGKQKRGFEMARAMTAWSGDIALCTNGPSRLSGEARAHLARNGIRLYEDRIERLDGRNGFLRAVVFADGRKLSRKALFFDTRTYAQSKLAKSLGCQFTRHGGVKCGQYEATSVPGVFVAGNIIKDVQLAIVAAAEGTRAAFGINKTLTREDFAANATGSRRVQHPATESKSMQRRRK
ncbi:MAG TPA: NAD(P)/FAD-dependent oxidoreductase [Vicinamibacterales bacterium]|nr:NAD(P)/FAD-dependent oxidoreductase [Vicinamibacterales bacterium]